MFKPLLFLFIVIPIVEISILMHVGEWLGAWPTVGIVIFTAWLGAKNVRAQGMATMQTVQTKMAQGQMPSEEIVAGVLLLIAGVLLMTPGFVTDTFGLLLLVPTFRSALIGTVQQQMKVKSVQGSAFNSSQGFNQYNVYDHEDDASVHTSHSNHNEHEKALYQNKDSAHNEGRQSEPLDGEFERKD